MRPSGFGALVLALLLAPAANAEPSLWEKAKTPGSKARAKARLRAEQLFDEASDPRAGLETLRNLSLGSAALMELGGDARRDPWQQVLLGRVLLDTQQGREREALQLIEGGLLALPDTDFKRSSLFDVGLAALFSGEMAHASKAFTAALGLAWRPDDRATLHRNRGKARMLSGQPLGAVADFRAAVQLARGVEVMALSRFGLGVALERSGDYPQGMQEVARGVALRLPVPPYSSESVLDMPGLRWIPEYDQHYFRALGAMSEVEQAETTELLQEHYEAALESWEQYVPAAEANKDRFLANALRHRQRCLDALARLRAQPARSGRVR